MRDLKTIWLPACTVVGLTVRTDNTRASVDIPAVAGQFASENLAAKIRHRSDDNLVAVYTEYEGDFTQPYTYMFGCLVDKIDRELPKGLVALELPKRRCVHLAASGDFPECLIEKWVEVWNADWPRAYTADIEVYGPNATSPASLGKHPQGTVDLYIAVEG